MSIKKLRLLIYLFLIPPFFIRISYGPENEYVAPSFGWIQMLIGLVCLGGAFKLADSGRRALIFFFIGSFLVLMHFHFVVWVKGTQLVSLEFLAQPFWSLYLYLFFCIPFGFLTAKIGFSVLEDVFLTLSLLTVWITVATLFIFYSTGFALLLNFYGGGGIVRPHAFLSEPSGLVAPVSFIAGVGVLRRRWSLFLTGVLGAWVSQSALVLLGAAVIILAAMVIRAKYKLRRALALMFLAGLGVGFMLTYSCDDNPLGLGISTYKAVCGVQALKDIDNQYLLNLNTRLLSTVQASELLSSQDAWITGLGLNSSSVLLPVMYGNIENSLAISMLIFFGVGGLFVFVLTGWMGIIKSYKIGPETSIWFASLLFGSTFNSAGGFYWHGLYIVALVGLFVISKPRILSLPALRSSD